MLTRDELLKLLVYEPATGELLWKPRDELQFASAKRGAAIASAVWNARFSGKPALNTVSRAGYKHGHIGGRLEFAHRVIWVMMTGHMPDNIDHINGNPSDNRFENLRSVDAFSNLKNMRRSKRNTTGVTGVWLSPAGRYVAEIHCDGRKISLGRFDTLDEARAARAIAEERYGFHRNHGKLRSEAL